MGFKKDKKQNVRKIFDIRIISLLILGTVLFTSVGFSAFWQTLNITSSLAEVRLNENVRVTNFDIYSTANSGGSTYEEYNVDSVMSGLVLPHANSTVTYKMEVTNFINEEFGISSLTNLPSNLEYSVHELVSGKLVDYNLKTKICDSKGACSLGVKKDIYITIKYKSGQYSSSNTNFALKLGVEFKKYFSVSYVNLSNNNYPTSILSGDNLSVNFGSTKPLDVIVKVNGTEVNNYTYSGGVLTLNNVTGNVTISPVTMAKYVTRLYNSNANVVNNGVTYGLDTSDKLIDDKLGGTASSGNIRYYGANPNNYVNIGDAALWRVIGVFKNVRLSNGSTQDLVKVVRADDIGAYSWGYNSAGTAISNDWNQSMLKEMLNSEDTSKGSFYLASSSVFGYFYNYDTGKPQAYNFDFSSRGLRSGARSKVESVYWDLGGNTNASIYPDGVYKAERTKNPANGNPTEWKGKIALMYSSDYAYATDLSTCSVPINVYGVGENPACSNNDWLHTVTYKADGSIDYEGYTYLWVLTTNPNSKTATSFVFSDGNLYNAADTHAVLGIKPVMYLKADTIVTSGNGTSSNPYIIN